MRESLPKDRGPRQAGGPCLRCPRQTTARLQLSREVCSWCGQASRLCRWRRTNETTMANWANLTRPPRNASKSRRDSTRPRLHRRFRDAGGSRTHWKAALQAAAVPSGSSVIKRPRQESNLDLNLRRVACQSSTPRGRNLLAARRGVEPRLAVSRTAVRSGTLAGCVSVSRPGFEPGPGPSEGPCNPLHHRDKEPTTGFAPASAEESNPVRAVLEAAGSPRSTLVYVPLKWAARVSEGSRTLTSWFTARHAATATPQTP